MWNAILIAQPGEVAARVARTCRRLGITAIAAVGESRRVGAHTDACDDVHVLPERPDGSVDPADVVKIVRQVNADAVFAGYGTGAWERELAHALEAADIPFVGADPDSMDVAFDRLAVRSAGERATVRMLPGSSGPIASLADAFTAADAAGYPVVLRPVWALAPIPSARFEDEGELERGFDEYKRQAGDVPFCLDHDIERARVVDVLLAADMHGEIVGICEQESTLSTDGKPLLDESPSPELAMRADGEAIRTALFDSAIRLAAELRTPGLVTVRFLLDARAHAFVSEVELGLPAQHAIAEMVTGLDLVAVQLAIAAGEPIPDEVHTAEPSGHAFGAAVGLGPRRPEELAPVREIRFPPAPQRQVRVEPAIVEGQIPWSESLDAICRVTTYAPIRHQALLALDRMLAELEISPLEIDVPRLRSVIASESYRAGQYDTSVAVVLARG